MVVIQPKVIRTFKTPMDRQVGEAVKLKLAVKEKIHILNSKLEFNACILPEIRVIHGKKLKTQEEDGEKKIQINPENEEKTKMKGILK